MGFDVVVLGSSGMYPSAERACSSYLVRGADARVVVDCGPGSTVNLARFTPFRDVDAVVLTHMHTDHCLDLIGVYYALWFEPTGARSIPVYAPPGAADLLRAVLTPDAATAFDEVCRFVTIGPGDRFTVGTLSFELFESSHTVPTVSVRISSDGKVAVYSSDSSGGPNLVTAATGADLFLCESTWESDQADVTAGGHMSAGQAGAIAQQAGVRRLVLTHLRPGNDEQRAIAEASRSFTGPIDVARDGQVWIMD